MRCGRLHHKVLTNENVVELRCQDAKIAPQPVSNDHGLQAIYLYHTKVLFAGVIPYKYHTEVTQLWEESRVTEDILEYKVVEMVGPGAAMGDAGRAEYCGPIISPPIEWGALLVQGTGIWQSQHTTLSPHRF